MYEKMCVKFCSEIRSTEQIKDWGGKWENDNIPSFKPNRKVANAFFWPRVGTGQYNTYSEFF